MGAVRSEAWSEMQMACAPREPDETQSTAGGGRANSELGRDYRSLGTGHRLLRALFLRNT